MPDVIVNTLSKSTPHCSAPIYENHYNHTMNQTDLLGCLVEIEETISYVIPPPLNTQPFVELDGTLPILISAPHATAHTRAGKIKGEEEYTAAFAHLLGKVTGAFVMYTQFRSFDDSNWDKGTPYKNSLREVVARNNIRFVLDLHGMSNRHKIGIALGTMNGRSCPEQESLIANTLKNHNFHSTLEANCNAFPHLQWDRFVINHSRFTGGIVNHTITRFASERLGINAAQIELCSSIRVVGHPHNSTLPPFKGNSVGIARIFNALSDLIYKLAENSG